MSLSTADRSLIVVPKASGGAAFVLGACVPFVLLSLAWASFLTGFIENKLPFAYTSGETNVGYLVRSLRRTDADIAIAGSSFSKQLEPGLFSRARVVNLSVEGGSVLTSLEALRSARFVPKVLLIETNILYRPLDSEWRADAAAGAGSSFQAMIGGAAKPLRYLLRPPVFSYLLQQDEAEWWANRREQLRSSEPAVHDSRLAIQKAISGWNKPKDWKLSARNSERIKALAKEFESHGSVVLLLNLPYSPELDAHPFASRNRRIASGSDDFDCDNCLDLRKVVDMAEMRWTDGAHLDQRSAALAARALEARLAQFLSGRP